MARPVHDPAVRDRHPQCVQRLFSIEMKQLRATEWDRKSQVGASRPAARAEIRLTGVFLKPQHDLVSGDNGRDEFLAAGAHALGNRENRWNVKAWMAGIRTRMTIHEVKKAQRSAIDQRCLLARSRILRP